jgi:hypothetical protein
MSSGPHDLDRALVADILRQIEPIHRIGPRVEAASRRFLGYPYRSNPLIGSLEEEEIFTVSLKGFDCVTYMETSLALARATSPAAFVSNLSLIRYSGGVVSWKTRHHYMTQWIRENERAGIVRSRTLGASVVARQRRLDVVEGLPAVTISVRSIPKQHFMRHVDKVQTGDLLFFASTRRNLDVFHCGILVRRDVVLLRHSPRSRGEALDQDLSEFLAANRMSGVILVRPSEIGRD